MFDVITAAKKIEDIPYFSPGTGTADTEFCSPKLWLSNLSHNHFAPIASSRNLKPTGFNLFFSLMKDDKAPTDWSTVYLVVFVNLKQTDEIDSYDYKCMILDFGK